MTLSLWAKVVRFGTEFLSNYFQDFMSKIQITESDMDVCLCICIPLTIYIPHNDSTSIILRAMRAVQKFATI